MVVMVARVMVTVVIPRWCSSRRDHFLRVIVASARLRETHDDEMGRGAVRGGSKVECKLNERTKGRRCDPVPLERTLSQRFQVPYVDS